MAKEIPVKFLGFARDDTPKQTNFINFAELPQETQDRVINAIKGVVRKILSSSKKAAG